MKVKITGDISYESKNGLTVKGVFFFVLGMVIGILLFMLMRNTLSVIFSTIIAAIIGIAIIACGFLKFGGMPVTKVVVRLVNYNFGKGKYKYETEDKNV